MKIRRTLFAAIAFLTAAVAGAQTQPQVKNAQLETRAVSGNLESTMRGITSAQTAPLWVGYAAPMIQSKDGRRYSMCCGTWTNGERDCNPCALESSHGTNMTESDRPETGGGTVKLEGPAEMFVLLRVADHHVGRVVTLTDDCQADGGGLQVIWLTGVGPAESVALLAGIVTTADFGGRDIHEPADGALRAIAVHADASADKALASFVALDKPETLRSKTSFWLGNARGAAGVEALKRMAKNDPSQKVREQVTFALSQSSEKDALDELVRMAKEDQTAQVRGQALFWLAQKAGQRAVGAITEAIENDPDTEVKKKAVFALSQLPKDQGVPLMIQVASNNKNPAVRKQAMFWLGQSNDPRALAFFEQILTH
jgi:HEAT repeat protein